MTPPRYLFDAEAVHVAPYGVGVLIDRSFTPDAWEGDPLWLVVLERLDGTAIVAAFDPSRVVPAMINEEVSQRLLQAAWEIQEQRSSGGRDGRPLA